MSKISKGIFSFVLFISFLGGNTVVNAESVDSAPIDSSPVEELVALNEDFTGSFPLQISESEVLFFANEEDRELYITNMGTNPDYPIQPQAGVKTRVVSTSSQRRYNVFLGYNSLTPDWSFASHYDLDRGRQATFTTGYTYDGFSATLALTQSYGVTIRIPANSTRASRLGARGDVTLYKRKMEAYYGTTVISTFYSMSLTNQTNITNLVVYR